MLASQTLYIYLFEKLQLSTPNLDAIQIQAILTDKISDSLLGTVIVLVNQ
jgi:hypothetical protein